MSKLSVFHESLAGGIQSRIVSHKRIVSGKPEPSGYVFTFYDTMSALLPASWDNANHGNDVFLSSAYLTALENAPPANMKFKYVTINSGEGVTGIAYFQILELNLNLLLRPALLLDNTKMTLQEKIHSAVMSKRLLVCGNMLISGEHGYSICGISSEKAIQVIAEIAYILRKSYKVSATLIKDFYKKDMLNDGILSGLGYGSIDAGPNMAVPVRESWATFDDYLDDMKHKYKKQAVSVLIKGKSLKRRSLSAAELAGYKNEMYSLYCQVFKKAKFVLYSLSSDIFTEMKKKLPDKFFCDGYFLGSKMIGFTTRIINGRIMEGYVHGLSYERNKEFELYQNFLLGDMRDAINGHFLLVNTGRTSVAMKSSIGAVPEEMSCYLRFSGSHINSLLKPLLFLIKPRVEYCRNPFE